MCNVSYLGTWEMFAHYLLSCGDRGSEDGVLSKGQMGLFQNT